MMTCRNITELVTDYLEGQMSFMDRMRFRMHILMCKSCKEYLKQMQSTVKALGFLPDEPPSEEVQEELMKCFENWKGSKP